LEQQPVRDVSHQYDAPHERLPKNAPTDQIPIIRVDPRDGERELVMARLGLIPFWVKEKPKVPKCSPNAAVSFLRRA
jgi:putative SOS response-associated peptidase YedK